MAKKKSTEIENIIANARKATEEQLVALIDGLREIGYTEDVISMIRQENANNRKEVEKMNENRIVEEEMEMQAIGIKASDPFEAKREQLPEGTYLCKTLHARKVRKDFGEWALQLEVEITDLATGRVEEIKQWYNQGYFSALWDNFSRYYADHNPQTLNDCIKLSNQIEWYGTLKVNGDFVNLSPLRQTPTTKTQTHFEELF